VLGLAARSHFLARGFGEFLDRALEPGGAHRRFRHIAGDHAGKIALIAAEPLEPHQIEDFRAIEQPLDPRLKGRVGHDGGSLPLASLGRT
jgi:hypothetical protein